MTTVGSVGPTAAAAPPVGPRASSAPGAPALMPAADTPSMSGMQDVMAMLYQTMSEVSAAQERSGKTKIETAKAERDIAAKKQREALEKAKKAAEEGGFFDWVADDLGLAGAAGLVTFNYPLVVADVAAHKLGLFGHLEEKVDLGDAASAATGSWQIMAADLLLSKTDLAPEQIKKLREAAGGGAFDAPTLSKEDIEPVAKRLVTYNLAVASIAATVLSCGTTGSLMVACAGLALSYGGKEIAKEGTLDRWLGHGSSQWIGLGMQVYGTAAGCVSGLAGGAAIQGISKLATTAKTGAAVAQGAASALRGADEVVTTVHEYERDRANIDAEKQRAALARIDRLLDWIVDSIEDVQKTHRKAAETLQGAIDTANQTDLALAQGIKG